MIANLFSDNELESTRISGYLQDVFKFRTKQGLFTLVGGVRGSYWSYNKEFIFSPRASIGFIPNFDQNLTFRLASGLYYQSPFYKELRTTVQDEHHTTEQKPEITAFHPCHCRRRLYIPGIRQEFQSQCRHVLQKVG